MASSAPVDGLGEAVWALSRRLRAATKAAFAAYDVTPGQVRAIRVLDRAADEATRGVMAGVVAGESRGGVRGSELAHELGIAPRSATEVVDALEAKGLVERSPDPRDRRATLVTLTDRGRGLSAEVRRLRIAESERIFGRLSSTEREQLARLLAKLQD